MTPFRRIAYVREPRKQPVALGADEVVRSLEAIPGLKIRTALTTVYAAGLRVSEVVLPKIADIDSHRMVMYGVKRGKGRQGPLRHALSATPEGILQGRHAGAAVGAGRR